MVRTLGKWLAILLISLIAGEIALRVYHHFSPLHFVYDESYKRLIRKPFTADWDGFRLNSRGFKDLEFPEKRTSTFRILGLGDSFAYGVVPYKFNYHTRLEELFKGPELDVEVLNMGIPSVGPKDYLDLLVREGLDLDPDHVLVSFFVGNDYSDSRIREVLQRRWHSYSLLTSLLHYMISVRPHYEGRVPHRKSEYRDHAPTFDRSKFLEIEGKRSVICRVGHRQMQSDLRSATHYLKQISHICAIRGIGVTVIIIPDELQVSPDLQQQLTREYMGLKPAIEWDWAQPSRLLAEELTRQEIDFIDLYEAFLNGSQEQRLYKLRDTHWNIAGNELAAQKIFEHLQEAVATGLQAE